MSQTETPVFAVMDATLNNIMDAIIGDEFVIIHYDYASNSLNTSSNGNA